MKPQNEKPKSVYARVTDQVLAELAKGTAPWRKPWRAEFGLPRNLDSRKAYRGVNVLVLMSSALSAGYPANWWLTFNQAKERGGHVNKDEHGYPVVFYQRTPVEPESDEPTAEQEAKKDMHWRPVLKVYTVFNVAQCSGVEVPADAPQLAWQPVEAAERIVETVGLPIHYEGVEAFYRPARDEITMPPRVFFPTVMGFYETLLHELVHATGHESRLARTFGIKGTEAYAWEELIAEMGSAMLSVVTGVPTPDFPNLAAYLDSWRACMNRNPQAIGEAAAAAQKAAEWLLQKAGMALPA